MSKVYQVKYELIEEIQSICCFTPSCASGSKISLRLGGAGQVLVTIQNTIVLIRSLDCTDSPLQQHIEVMLFILTFKDHCQCTSLPVNTVRQPLDLTEWEYPAVRRKNTLRLVKSLVTLFKPESKGKADISLDLLADYMNSQRFTCLTLMWH